MATLSKSGFVGLCRRHSSRVHPAALARYNGEPVTLLHAFGESEGLASTFWRVPLVDGRSGVLRVVVETALWFSEVEVEDDESGNLTLF
jgi:hypothetical protein